MILLTDIDFNIVEKNEGIFNTTFLAYSVFDVCVAETFAEHRIFISDPFANHVRHFLFGGPLRPFDNRKNVGLVLNRYKNILGSRLKEKYFEFGRFN